MNYYYQQEFNLNHVRFMQDEETGEWIAYLEEIPTTQAYGENKGEAFRNLIILLHDKK